MIACFITGAIWASDEVDAALVAGQLADLAPVGVDDHRVAVARAPRASAGRRRRPSSSRTRSRRSRAGRGRPAAPGRAACGSVPCGRLLVVAVGPLAAAPSPSGRSRRRWTGALRGRWTPTVARLRHAGAPGACPAAAAVVRSGSLMGGCGPTSTWRAAGSPPRWFAAERDRAGRTRPARARDSSIGPDGRTRLRAARTAAHLARNAVDVPAPRRARGAPRRGPAAARQARPGPDGARPPPRPHRRAAEAARVPGPRATRSC